MAQIDCPNCKAAFDVDEHVLRQGLDKQGQRHLRCGACQHVFTFTPSPEVAELEDEISFSPPPPKSAVQQQTGDLEIQPDLPDEYPDFVATRSPLMAPKMSDSSAENMRLTSDFGVIRPQKTTSNPQKQPTKLKKQRSGLTAFLAFLILVTLIVLFGIWVSMTHPEWFRASYWLETYT